MEPPTITLLTDFGLRDHYVAAMKGVMLGICPQARFVDITHDVAPYSILEAAYILSQAWKCFPGGTIHLVVVDPGVGSARRPILAKAGGQYFIAPDNGVLTMALDAARKSRVRHITAERYFRHPVSQTFHGRDIFSAAAAHLAAGTPASAFGKVIDNAVRLDLAKPRQTGPHKWTGAVLSVDRFGNIVTSFDWTTFAWIAERPFKLKAGRGEVTRHLPNYDCAPAGEPFAIHGSADFVEISLKQSHAGHALGVECGSPVLLSFR
jgi:S-adenosylmethionine hydrolase